ncbi:uncharacterized protein LOC136022098 [Lathamus discolor]|uniref:uncharacterized protein LOC136022098 n=1 Tax=Lathamus discolor TaxID=678569 RepID=UPI0032B79AA0
MHRGSRERRGGATAGWAGPEPAASWGPCLSQPGSKAELLQPSQHPRGLLWPRPRNPASLPLCVQVISGGTKTPEVPARLLPGRAAGSWTCPSLPAAGRDAASPEVACAQAGRGRHGAVQRAGARRRRRHGAGVPQPAPGAREGRACARGRGRGRGCAGGVRGWAVPGSCWGRAPGQPLAAPQHVRQLYALVSETLRYSPVLEELLAGAALLRAEKKLSPQLAKVLVYDLLFGKGLKCGGRWKALARRHRARLEAELARLKVRQKVSRNEDLLAPAQAAGPGASQVPRYVRVNTLKTCVDDVIDFFKRQGNSYLGKAARQTSMRTCCTLQDTLFCRTAERTNAAGSHGVALWLCFHNMYGWGYCCELGCNPQEEPGPALVAAGGCGEASCLPAFLLSPAAGSHGIDACAAPGNKTSHLAAILKNKGQIFAFDVDTKRLATMSTMLMRAGVTGFQLAQQGFLTVDPGDPKYSKVSCILLDTACSGSGWWTPSLAGPAKDSLPCLEQRATSVPLLLTPSPTASLWLSWSGAGTGLLPRAPCLWLLMTACSMAREQSQEQLPGRGRGKSSRNPYHDVGFREACDCRDDPEVTVSLSLVFPSTFVQPCLQTVTAGSRGKVEENK